MQKLSGRSLLAGFTRTLPSRGWDKAICIDLLPG